MLNVFMSVRLWHALPCLLLLSSLALALDTNRITEIVAWLPEKPEGIGPDILDRAAWAKLASHPAYRDVVREAEMLTKRPIEAQPDELYLDFSRTGNRDRWQTVAFRRRARIATLALAECLENKGCFTATLGDAIQAVCAEKTWVMPAHDRSLDDFNQRTITIDLASSALGWNLAMVEHLLGDRLPSETRALMKLRIRERVIVPYKKTIEGKHRRNWWYRGNNNWNAVCMACATGTALITVDSPAERALFVAGAEAGIASFLSGFTPDGYCSEGIGYWNYGYGHFILLTETLRQATGGKLDLFDRSEARPPALFPLGLEIVNNVYPSFADCSVGSHPNPRYMRYICARYGLDLPKYDAADTVAPAGMLAESMIFSFPAAWQQSAAKDARRWKASPLRTWFEDAGILICRTEQGIAGSFGVALKGGHNGEHHNHNDVGSYVTVVGKEALLLDPGAEVYTARTFSAKRYDSKVLNSFGHPVPVVGGQLQLSGGKARARVVRTEFTDARDTFVLDLKPVYTLKALIRLDRTFVYSRESGGSLSVLDAVAYAEPQTFETALITLGNWQRVQPDTLLVWVADEALTVRIDTGGLAYRLEGMEIDEDVRTRTLPKRIGIALSTPVTAATVRITIAPANRETLTDTGGLLHNGSFEWGSWAWSLGEGAIATVTDEDASDGTHALKLTDTTKQEGSSVHARSIAAKPDTGYVLSGKVRHIAGEGIGLYAFFKDRDGRTLNPMDPHGQVQPFATLKSSGDGEWADFTHTFRTLAETSSLQIWIHSYNGAMVTAYLDELKLAKKPQSLP